MKSYVTAGVAIVGASAIAAAPIAAVPQDVAVRAADIDSVNLLAQPTPSPLFAEFIGTPAPGAAVDSLAAADALAAFGRLAEGVTQSGLNLVTANLSLGPGLLAIAQAAAAGDRGAVYDGVEAIIDGPLSVAKPLFEALEAVLPPPIGGEQDADPGLVWDAYVQAWQIRNIVRAITAEIIAPPADQTLGAALAAQSNVFGDPAATLEVLADKFSEAGQKFVTANLLLGPGLLAIGAALAQGDNAAASAGVQSIIDGPLYVAKPLFEAFEAVSPPPIGGEQDADPGLVWDAFVRSLAVRDKLDDIADGVINPQDDDSAAALRGVNQNASGAADVVGTVTGGNTVGDPGTTQKRRQLVNLDVLKDTPLAGGGRRVVGGSSAQQGSDTSHTGTTRTPTHRPGLGKTPVRDLVKRITGGGDRDADSGGAETSSDN